MSHIAHPSRDPRPVLRQSAAFNHRAVLGVCVLLTLSTLDALLTLMHLGRGAYEANPLMAYLLEHGTGTFLVGKLALTAAGAVLVCACLRAHVAQRALVGVSSAYVLLLGWHLVLAVA